MEEISLLAVFCEIADWLTGEKVYFICTYRPDVRGEMKQWWAPCLWNAECLFSTSICWYFSSFCFGARLFLQKTQALRKPLKSPLHFEESDGLRGFLFTLTNAIWVIFIGNLKWAIYINDRYQWRSLNGSLNVEAARKLQQMAKPRLPHGGHGTQSSWLTAALFM